MGLPTSSTGGVCLLEGSVSGGLCLGVCVLGSVSGSLCKGVSVWGGVCPGGHCSGRYASYWNAFLFLSLN